MSKIERGLLKGYLGPAHVMLEWGPGHYTKYYAREVTTLYSIEHDITWCNVSDDATVHYLVPHKSRRTDLIHGYI